MGKFIRRSLWVLLLLLLAAMVAGVAIYKGVGRGPKVDGQLSLPGLTDKVRVLRDAHGIPY
ncbi:MAG TPA: hypothetical protein VET87_17130, partial [Rubrivivax sp.]|nr:hypothetical protein [Rubrivivax sp.]